MHGTTTIQVPPDAHVADGGRPYYKGRNGFSRLDSLTVEHGRTPAEVRLEIRSARSRSGDPPALVMMPAETAAAVGRALIEASRVGSRE